ncbi:hypothetical protein B0H63DRAFT_550555 [Podospora didyma]|uniref:Uncharacterized protein n=1 Tax=Podospora didyma TaxID=330526 RepID=A0AAE0N608_9PEZI|nr:hypothetical protein B0H63DRAFT_550555 [Podospora didyma]
MPQPRVARGLPISAPSKYVVLALHCPFVCRPTPLAPMKTPVFHAIESLWRDGGVQSYLKRCREYQLADSSRYYFDNIARIAA